MGRENRRTHSRSAGYARYKGRHRMRGKRRGVFPGGFLILAAAALVTGALLFALRGVGRIELHERLTVEAGGELPGAKAFLAEDGAEVEISYLSDLASVQADVPGSYEVKLLCDGKERKGYIDIVDTVPPAGTVRELTVYQNAMPEAADFVVSVQDATEVSVTYETQPDQDIADRQTLTLLLTDAGGNVTKLTAALTVIIDHDAPVIEGAANIVVYIGDTVAYRSGVTARDSIDEAPTLTIDSSAVDLTKPGVYTVTYLAEDKAGNRASQAISVTVLEKKDEHVELETVYAAADNALSGIVRDGQTPREQVEAIYNWARTTLNYSDGSGKDDWVQEAYAMLTGRTGDCFSYFAITKLMFERLGIPNIDVHKVKNYEGDSSHYWSLVSVDGGKTYYHFDATPRRGEGDDFCLVTDAFLDAYSAEHGNSHNRDKSLYPATPEV